MNFTADISRADDVRIPEIRTTVTHNKTMSVDHLEHLSQNVTTLTDYLNQTNSLYGIADISLPNSTYILFGLICFLTLLGMFGNSLTLAIMVKLQNKPLKGHDILISALAIFDLIALIPSALSHPCIYDVIGKDIQAITTIGCKLLMAIWQSAMISSYTVITLICIERFIAVWYPLKARYILSREFIIRCLLITVIPLGLVYASMAVLFSEISDGICFPNLAGKQYSSILKRKPHTTFLIAISVVILGLYLAILCSFTPMILVKLYQQNVRRRRIAATEQDIDNFRTSLKLIAVVVVFLVYVMLPFGNALNMRLAGTPLLDADRALLSSTLLLMLLNHSTNFLLYTLIDAEFRRNAVRFFSYDKGPSPVLKRNTLERNPEQAETSFTCD